MESIWSKTINFEEREALSGDIYTEVVIIGAGMAGILTAYLLSQKGVKSIILEAKRIAGGQTKNTTAKITSQHSLIYDKLIKNFGEDKARQYASANQEAILRYLKIIEQNNIDCNFNQVPSFLYSTKEEEGLIRETEAAKKLGIAAEFTNQTTLPFSIKGAVKFEKQAQFHPLEFVKEIIKSLTIYEHTEVKKVEENRVITDLGIVNAKHIVFATHYPFINMPGYYFLRMHQERSYVITLENASKIEGMYYGIDQDGLSFRNFDNQLLLGGGNHRTGKNREGGQYEMLRKRARELYPDSIETAHWSAQDCMTLDDIPYIGQYSSTTPNWYVATGFKKWGMTSSMVSAIIISDQITNIENPNAEIFSPQRFTPSASAKTFLEEGMYAVKGLSGRIFAPPRAAVEKLPIGHGGIVEYNGDKVGVYKDENDEVYVVSIKCPHLGCQLEWNPDEKTWDCPCHGSRFDFRGNLMDNPAQEDLYHEEHTCTE